MKKQEAIEIEINDLHLWSGNPREVADINASDFDIVKMALEDKNGRWNLKNLYKDVKLSFFKSELLTVVCESVNGEKKYIVYDGNRRLALMKYLKNIGDFSKIESSLQNITVPEYVSDFKLPCNICDMNTALENVERKHINTNQWGILEKDYFLNRYRAHSKSDFIIFEEATNLISGNKALNTRFVKDEVLTETNLNSIGFSFSGGKLNSVYDERYSKEVLITLMEAILKKQIAKNRFFPEMLNKIIIELNPELENKILELDANSNALNQFSNLSIGEVSIEAEALKIRMFPNRLHLRKGPVDSIYKDILRIEKIYHRNKAIPIFSKTLNFSLRLLIESAAGLKDEEARNRKTKPKNKRANIRHYIDKHFKKAMEKLSEDEEKSLSKEDIGTEQKLTDTLQDGGHYQTEERTYEEACRISIIVGAILMEDDDLQ